MNFRDFFQFDPAMVHLNNAGTAALPLRARDRLQSLADQLAHQAAQAIPGWNQEVESARKIYAQFLETKSRHIAFTANLATSVSQVAWSLPFRAGDTILTLDQEYPSNAYPWLAVAKAKNLRVSVQPSRADYGVDWDQFIGQIRSGVRAVALSWVQFKAGTTAPLVQIGEACRAVGAWMIVDSIQGLGVMPFAWTQHQADIVCGGSHKWLCGPTGHGFIAFRDELFLELTPPLQGAMTFGTPDDPVDPQRPPVASAVRFEPGCPAHMFTLTAAESIRLLAEFGITKIHRHAMGLALELIDELESQGWQIWGDPRAHRQSPIVTFSGPGVQQAHERLLRAKISHAFRHQSIRLSPHGFNTAAEIALALATIRKV